MKIALTANGPKWDSQIDLRFGRTEYIFVYDANKEEISHFNNGAIENSTHGAGEMTIKGALKEF
ncbi:MAG: hypothetical protein H8E14_16175 [Candidatus Marinimicrobia bacterium]|nr:hypothetical protein [Candidatus Neomarinimicrobiota bacterium]